METFGKHTLEIEQNWRLNRDLQAGFGDERQAPDLGHYHTTARPKAIASARWSESALPVNVARRAATQHGAVRQLKQIANENPMTC